MAAQLTQPRRIVLVEEDDICSRQVASALRRSFTDLDVQPTKDPDEALALLADEASRLLITDAQTRELDGIAIATSARERRPELPVIVLSSPPCGARRIPRLGEAAWLEKPPKTDRLVGLVERLLAAPIGFSGALTLEGLPDLVQLLSTTHTTGALHVRSGQRRGGFWFEAGAIVDAGIGTLRGASAVYEIRSCVTCSGLTPEGRTLCHFEGRAGGRCAHDDLQAKGASGRNQMHRRTRATTLAASISSVGKGNAARNAL